MINKFINNLIKKSRIINSYSYLYFKPVYNSICMRDLLAYSIFVFLCMGLSRPFIVLTSISKKEKTSKLLLMINIGVILSLCSYCAAHHLHSVRCICFCACVTFPLHCLICLFFSGFHLCSPDLFGLISL